MRRGESTRAREARSWQRAARHGIRIRSQVALYLVGHHWHLALLLIAAAVLAVTLVEGRVIALPWLRGEQRLNAGTLASLAYAAAVTIIYRNELSRLESLNPRRWLTADALCLAILWFLPWALAATGLASFRWAYATTVLVGLCVAAGALLRTDTLGLVLIAQLLAQSALWGALEHSPARHLLFMLDEPRIRSMLLPSALAFAFGCAAIAQFKRGT